MSSWCLNLIGKFRYIHRRLLDLQSKRITDNDITRYKNGEWAQQNRRKLQWSVSRITERSLSFFLRLTMRRKATVANCLFVCLLSWRQLSWQVDFYLALLIIVRLIDLILAINQTHGKFKCKSEIKRLEVKKQKSRDLLCFPFLSLWWYHRKVLTTKFSFWLIWLIWLLLCSCLCSVSVIVVFSHDSWLFVESEALNWQLSG